jgi:hypothetical protein
MKPPQHQALRQVCFLSVSFAFTILLCLPNESNAKCVLPVPDGTDEVISNRNLAGRIQAVNAKTMKVEDYRTKQIVRIDVTKVPTAYSAYGGDAPTSTLKARVPIKVWYQQCKKTRDGNTIAAYIEFFSADPADLPPKNYFGINSK